MYMDWADLQGMPGPAGIPCRSATELEVAISTDQRLKQPIQIRPYDQY